MAKLLFIQDIAYEYMGIMYISSYLKKHGHDCDVLIEFVDKNILGSIKEKNPDLIGFSTLSGSFKWGLKLARKIKEEFPDKPIIFGGVHVYSSPSIVINCDAIDIICTGEGEESVKELCDSIDAGKIDTSIKGLWFKVGDEIIKNPMTQLNEDLDDLPFPDRQIYWKYPDIEGRDILPILGSRGCPYTCAYCFIPKAKEIFEGLGKFVRQRSAANILEEINACAELSSKKKVVQFVEDHFGNNRTRTLEILQGMQGLKHEVKWCGAIRIERFKDEKYVKALSETNHHILGLAVECGNEEYRNNVLSREVKNEDIINAADLARKYGIRFVSLNMLGLPGETFEMALETLDLNIRIKPEYVNCYVYQPYAETKLKDYGVEHNYFVESVADELGFSFYDRYNHEDKELQKVINLQRVFGIIVAFPRLRKVLVSLSQKSWSKTILDGLFGMFYLYYLVKYYKVSFGSIMTYIRLWVVNQYNRRNNPVSDTIAKGKGQLYSPK